MRMVTKKNNREDTLPSKAQTSVTASKTKMPVPLSTKPSMQSSPAKTTSFETTKQKYVSEEKPMFGDKRKGPTTRIIVKYDVGFNNSIYLRGEGADLSWERGLLLKNVKADEWHWETTLPFSKCEFKVLINDRQYELGDNHILQCGKSFEYTPIFHKL